MISIHVHQPGCHVIERRPKAEEPGARHVTFATRVPEHVYELNLHFIAIIPIRRLLPIVTFQFLHSTLKIFKVNFFKINSLRRP
jgi:hypothetical protein